MEPLAIVMIDVPYKSSGCVIHQRPVQFEVYQLDGHFSLRPCLNESERQVANLPEELRFVMEGGKPVSLRGKMDGNLHVIQDAVAVLRDQQQLL